MYTRPFRPPLTVTTRKGSAHLQVHLLGPHPILQHFLDRMHFSAMVGSCLGTPREGRLDHAQTLSVLIQNIILSPAPLYRIAEWAEPLAPQALGISVQEKRSLNDDRVARCLDALASVRARNLFFRLALHIIKKFELDTGRIHHDTTTVTFHGRYDHAVRQPRITHGMNKDHRPDLKQLVFGLNVTGDGAVPISHEIYDGNRTDDTIHRSNLDRLREILGREDFIYVADSKLCTRKNLKHLAGYGGKFVTVLPRTWAEDKRFRKDLRSGPRVRWRRFLVLENQRRERDPPDIYYTTADAPAETGDGYRIIWCRSSQKTELDAQIREAGLQRIEAELFDLNSRLNRGRLRKPTFIKQELKRILRSHKGAGDHRFSDPAPDQAHAAGSTPTRRTGQTGFLPHLSSQGSSGQGCASCRGTHRRCLPPTHQPGCEADIEKAGPADLQVPALRRKTACTVQNGTGRRSGLHQKVTTRRRLDPCNLSGHDA